VDFDYVIVGAGLAGATIAERLASQLNKRVLIIEKRNHIGGNVYDYYNEDGILVQKYGPHIFHTSHKEVWDYLSQFTKWNYYIHRVIANVLGIEVYLPINIDTIAKLSGIPAKIEDFRDYLNERRILMQSCANSKDIIVSQVGEELYEIFFHNYTKKQWGLYPDQLAPEVTSRLPVRFNRDSRYFTDQYQGIPKSGYTLMFDKMLSHPNIHLLLQTDYKAILNNFSFDCLIYTGPIDYFFDYVHGVLPYRSVDFVFETLDVEWFQNAAQVNYPNDYDFTRITEFKYMYSQKHHKTTICYEFPNNDGDPYYPIPSKECIEIYQKYYKLSLTLRKTLFIGRLAEYKYINMDEVVYRSLNLFNKMAKGD
jgi:UDP-galactopyranose mutase